jgi:hypothetical protein
MANQASLGLMLRLQLEKIVSYLAEHKILETMLMLWSVWEAKDRKSVPRNLLNPLTNSIVLEWYPTWEENSEMQIKSVKMWQRKGYGTCK